MLFTHTDLPLLRAIQFQSLYFTILTEWRKFKTSGLKFLAYTGFRSMSQTAARKATKIIATDRSLIPEIQKYLKVHEQKVILIPNSVRMEQLADRSQCGKIRDKFGLHNANPLFLSVGRLEFNKGFHILLKALTQTKGLPPEWRLVLAGSGSMADELRRNLQESKTTLHLRVQLVLMK